MRLTLGCENSAENGFELIRIIAIVLFGGRRLYSRNPSTYTATSPRLPVDPAIWSSLLRSSRGLSGSASMFLPVRTSADRFLRGSVERPAGSLTSIETERLTFRPMSNGVVAPGRSSIGVVNSPNPFAPPVSR
jgi:hypothetical protein